MIIDDNGIKREMTPEEIAQKEQERLQFLQSLPYAELVTLFIRERYTQDSEFALINNYLADSETYGEDYRVYQEYKIECKERARQIKPQAE